MRTRVDLRFEKGDPVREYWLAHGDGFAVETRRGRVVGHVLESVLDPDEGCIVSLVVRWTLLGSVVPGGTSELPAEKVQAAVPARGAFVLDGAAPQERKPRRAREPALPALRSAAGGAVRRASPLLQGGSDQLHRAAPVLRSFATLAAAWVVGVVAWTVTAVRTLVRQGVSEVKARARAGRHPE
jgi:hypothetical protein